MNRLGCFGGTFVRIEGNGIDKNQVIAGRYRVIDQKENRHGFADCPGAHIDIHIGRGIIENATRPPVHWPPDDIRAIGVAAAGRVDAKLAAKGFWRCRRTPGDTGPVAIAGRDGNMGEDPGLECASAAPDAQARRPPKGVYILDIGWIAIENKLCPPFGNLAGWRTVEPIHITHMAGDDIGRIAGVIGVGWGRIDKHCRQGDPRQNHKL